jgi:hypothetical protein
MADLRTRYLGMELRSPLVASSSPPTGSLDGLRWLEAAGPTPLSSRLLRVLAARAGQLAPVARVRLGPGQGPGGLVPARLRRRVGLTRFAERATRVMLEVASVFRDPPRQDRST